MLQQEYLILGGLLGFFLLGIVIVLIFATIFLKIGLGIAGAPETSFGTTFVTALLSAIVFPIPCLGTPILQWYFIKTRHGLGWGGAIVAWIIAILIPILITIGLYVLLFGAGSLLGMLGG
ncbi:MAG: hypothetical protein ACP6IU_11280 [Candidatus Asgardarchaeia archaeon]